MGLSPHLCFGGLGSFLNFVLFGWWWWFYFDFLGDYFFKGNFLGFLFCGGSLFIFV